MEYFFSQLGSAVSPPRLLPTPHQLTFVGKRGKKDLTLCEPFSGTGKMLVCYNSVEDANTKHSTIWAVMNKVYIVTSFHPDPVQRLETMTHSNSF